MTVSVDKKTLKVIFVLCVLAVVVCVAVGGYEVVSTLDYSKAEGTLIAVDRSVDTGLTNNSKSTILRYKKYSYVVDNQEYTCQYRTYILFASGIGSSKTIHYLSDNPNVVRDEFKIEIAVAGAVFFAFFGVVMLLFMRKADDTENSY